MVGLTGFEPAASSSRTRRATKLRHSPIAAPDRAQLGPRGRQAPASIPERFGRSESPSEAWDGPFSGVRHSLGTRVSRVASGRQAVRIGKYGEVPRPADTCSQVDPGSPVGDPAGGGGGALP